MSKLGYHEQSEIEAVMPFILWEQVWGMLLANGLHACVMLAVYGRAGTTKPNVKMSIHDLLTILKGVGITCIFGSQTVGTDQTKQGGLSETFKVITPNLLLNLYT